MMMRVALLFLTLTVGFDILLAQETTPSAPDSSQNQQKHRPGPPAGFKPKFPTMVVQQVDEPKSGTESISLPLNKHVPLSPEDARARIFGKDDPDASPEKVQKQISDLKRVRDFLAANREKAKKEAAEAPPPHPMSEQMKKQMEMMRAEMQASRAKGTEGYKTIPELGEQLSDYLFQGDILLSVEEAEALFGQGGQQSNATNPITVLRAKRGAKNFANYPADKWSNNIPYMFAADVDATRKSQILKAIQLWSDNTCLSFTQTTSTASPYMLFRAGVQGDGCYTTGIGKSGSGGQIVNLDDGCISVGTIAHEMGHRLALHHSQCRYDRDAAITVYLEKTYEPGQYQLQSTFSNDNQQVNYDYGSVMHYPADGFSNIEGDAVMVAKEQWMQNTMGQNYAPAFSDYLMMNRAYGCLSGCVGSTCQNGGFPSPKNCAKCVCPSGFGGDKCDQRQASTLNAQCTGATLTATSDWQYLEGTVNSPSSGWSPTNPVESCHWHIKAPAGQWLDLWVEEVGLNDGTCSIGCSFANIELKLGQFTRVGHRMCCQSDLGPEGYAQMTSTEGMAVVSAFSTIGSKSFKLWYIAY